MDDGPQTEVGDGVFARMVALRRDLHRHPELAFGEKRTMERIAEELSQLGIGCRAGVGGTGVVADLPGKAEGPRVALRADMDALPVQEATGLEFASVRSGVMHACGHDGHAAMLVGAAELLKASPPPTPVRLIWQPAEEQAKGASAMIDDGVLDGVAVIFGGHVDRHYPPGTLVVTEGAVNASTDMFTIEIKGRQGHGARPHEALDAVVVGSLMVTALQTIVSREVNPAHPSVVSVGSFHAGTASNVIAGSARLEGTIRAQDERVREHLVRAIKRIGSSIGALHEAEVDVTVEYGTPSLINTSLMAGLCREAAQRVVGEESVLRMETANMGGEDFAFFLEHVPGAYIRFGAQVAGREGYPAHSSQFDFHERALSAGAAWFDQVARVAGERLLRAELFGLAVGREE